MRIMVQRLPVIAVEGVWSVCLVVVVSWTARSLGPPQNPFLPSLFRLCERNSVCHDSSKYMVILGDIRLGLELFNMYDREDFQLR